MTQADKVVAIAQGEIGNAGGQKYWSWYGFDSRVSWCACFVSWVLDQAGVPCLDLRPLIYKAGTPEEDAAIQAGVEQGLAGIISKGCVQMLDFYDRADLRIGDVPAQPGDIVLYEWDESAGDGVDHVGIVESVEGTDPDTQILHMIEGNWGDKVSRTTYRYRDKRVFAICRPRYAEVPETIEAPFDLQTGDKGREVQLLQMALLMHSYSVGPDGMDGDFGAETSAAVQRFQTDHGLAADGIAGTDTWTALCGG